MRWKTLIGFVVLSWNLALHACPPSKAIKVLSYNVHSSEWMEFSKYWVFRRAAVQRMIEESSADIYHFQEVDEEQALGIARILPDHQLVQLTHNLAVFYRKSSWELLHSTRWRDSAEMSAGRVMLRPRAGSSAPAMELWTVWLDAEKLGSDDTIWSLAEILGETKAAPGLVTLSLKAEDALVHNRRLVASILKRWHLKQAAPETFRITSNGWWAERKFTADWHDAVLAREDWRLMQAEKIARRVEGSFPSTHFPLFVEYCPEGNGSDLWAGEL